MGPHNVVPVAAEHGVGLAAAGLPIREDSYVISFGAPADEGLDAVEHFALGAVGSKHSLELLLALAG